MKSGKINRRNWLKSGLIFSAGALVAPSVLAEKGGYNKFTGEFEFESELNGISAKLNYNENPYGPSKHAIDAFRSAAVEGNLYPDKVAWSVREMIAKEEGVSSEHIFLGSGSSEILTMTGLAYGADKGSLMSAHPTFKTMLDTAAGIGCDWQQIPLTSELKHDLPAMKAAVKDSTRLVYICNPNNPTGTRLKPDELKAFCNDVSQKVPVFVDEAYTDFLDDPRGNSMIGLVQEGKDVIIARTFSKIHGMAGLRVGYGIAKPEIANKITQYSTRLITVSGPTLAAATASFKDEEFKSMVKSKNAAARDYTYKELKRRGFKPTRSHTSFMIFPISMQPRDFLSKMRDEGVAVRSWTFDDRNWCRVSVGRMDEMEQFIAALKKVHKS